MAPEIIVPRTDPIPIPPGGDFADFQTTMGEITTAIIMRLGIPRHLIDPAVPRLTPDEAFLATICEAPEDDTPRLMYADFLEERGDAASLVRAEFIRVQCELPRLAQDLERVRQAIADGRRGHGPPEKLLRRIERLRRHEGVLWQVKLVWQWIPSALSQMPWWISEDGQPSSIHGEKEPPIRCEWRRGFVEQVTLSAEDWLRHGPDLVRAAPLTSVRLGDVKPQNFHNDSSANKASPLFGWWEAGGNEMARYSLPRQLWCLVAKLPGCVQHGFWADFESLHAALGAASTAALLWARLPADQR